MENEYFKHCVGQQDVKDMLTVYINAHKNGNAIPNILLVAPKGGGKNTFAEAFSDHLGEEIYSVNGTQMKSVKTVVNQLLTPIQGRRATIFIDEIHAMPKSVAMLMLTVLQPNTEKKSYLKWDDLTLEFDFHDHTFIGATTERHLIFGPLLDRFKEISLDEYKPEELELILKRHAGDIQFEDNTLTELVKYSRGNGRWAMKAAQDVQSYCSSLNTDKLGLSDIPTFLKTMGMFDLGLNRQEVNILKVLTNYSNGATLKVMCAKTGNGEGAQKDMEKYLERQGLMEIDGRRKITPKGVDYLRRLEQNGRI